MNIITSAGKAIAAFKSTQALSRGGERPARPVQVQPAEARDAAPDRTLTSIRATVEAPDENRTIKTVQVGDRRLAGRGSIVDILV